MSSDAPGINPQVSGDFGRAWVVQSRYRLENTVSEITTQPWDSCFMKIPLTNCLQPLNPIPLNLSFVPQKTDSRHPSHSQISVDRFQIHLARMGLRKGHAIKAQIGGSPREGLANPYLGGESNTSRQNESSRSPVLIDHGFNLIEKRRSLMGLIDDNRFK
jgi:hypothetical protein